MKRIILALALALAMTTTAMADDPKTGKGDATYEQMVQEAEDANVDKTGKGPDPWCNRQSASMGLVPTLDGLLDIEVEEPPRDKNGKRGIREMTVAELCQRWVLTGEYRFWRELERRWGLGLWGWE